MKIALIGYGKMGKEIDRLAAEKGILVSARFDIDNPVIKESADAPFDVAIHFAHPNSVVGHVEQLAALGKHLVIGTTGWQQQFDQVRKTVEQFGIGCVHATNFSLGVNLLLHLTRRAGELINAFPEYDVFVHETHHKDKIDSPSGTALSITDELLKTIKRKKRMQLGNPEQQMDPAALHVSSARGGTVVGTHTITFDSFADSIELTHTAKNRSGFASGALVAAEWVKDKQGMFGMDDVLQSLVK